jgi:hypothetical protein
VRKRTLQTEHPARAQWLRYLSVTLLLGVTCLQTAYPHLSWGQENVLNQGPMPDAVEKLPDALKLEKPLPLPWLLPELRRTLRGTLHLERPELSPFFRDTDVTLKLRTYYFNQDTDKANTPDTFNEAWALGGSLAYQSGWWREILSIGAEVFTSQKLYGPLDRDGTLLLRPGQREYTVVGRAYAELQYKEHTAMLYRQYVDLPYVNTQDNRMTPNTFEGYTFYRRTSRFRYGFGYIDKIKRRDSSTFISMAQAAGVPGNRKRGLAIAGAAYVPSDDFLIGTINSLVPDVMNTVYAETYYTWAVSQELHLKLSTQFTDQRSVGKELLSSFATRVVSSQAALSYKNAIVRTAFSSTASGAAIQSPFGTYPGYLNLITKDFDRAGESAWLLGLAYDFTRVGVPGLSLALNYAHGYGARDSDPGKLLPDEAEFDLTVDYRIQQGPLRGVWFRLRNGYVDFDHHGGSSNNVRLIVNYELPVL